MEVMTAIPYQSLDVLRHTFENSTIKSKYGPTGLTIDEFVEALMRYLPLEGTEEARLERAKDLMDLFYEIDINADSLLEWDEFSSYCIELAMTATRESQEKFTFNFMEDLQFEDHGIRKKVVWIRHVPENQQLLIQEEDSHVLKVYNLKFILVREIDVSPNVEVLSTIIAVEYAKNLNLVIVFTSSLELSFWGMEDYRCYGRFTTRAIRSMHYCSSQRLLFTTTDAGTILVWILQIKCLHGKYQCLCVPKGDLTGHTQMVLSFAAVARYNFLATGGMDSNIILWDLESLKIRTKLMGHTTGVRHILYVPTHDLLLSTAFEFEVKCWDMRTHTVVLTLAGHNANIIGMKSIFTNGIENVLTADKIGSFKLWDLQRTVTGHATCLENFAAGEGATRFCPRVFEVIHNHRQVVAGNTSLRLFKSIRDGAQEVNPSHISYNSEFNSFYMVKGTAVVVFDASTGLRKTVFAHITEHEITAFTFDERQRKFIIGNTKGDIMVCNAITGELMKQSTIESSEVISITGLIYAPHDRLVIVSTEQSVHIFDENETKDLAEGPSLPHVRHVMNAHGRSVTCTAFSYSLSLIATGSSDFTVRIWDFQFFRLEGICVGHKAEIVQISFIHALPLLISADFGGTILIWLMRPAAPACSPVGMCVNSFSPAKLSIPEALTAFLTQQDASDALEKKKKIVAAACRKFKLLGKKVDLPSKAPDESLNKEDNDFSTFTPSSKSGSDNPAIRKSPLFADIALMAIRSFITNKNSPLANLSEESGLQSYGEFRRSTALQPGLVSIPFTAMDVSMNQKGQAIIVTGDLKGRVREWSFQKLIDSLSLRPVCEKDRACNQDGYNARRICDVDCAELNVKIEKALSEGGSVDDVRQLKGIREKHTENITERAKLALHLKTKRASLKNEEALGSPGPMRQAKRAKSERRRIGPDSNIIREICGNMSPINESTDTTDQGSTSGRGEEGEDNEIEHPQQSKRDQDKKQKKGSRGNPNSHTRFSKDTRGSLSIKLQKGVDSQNKRVRRRIKLSKRHRVVNRKSLVEIAKLDTPVTSLMQWEDRGSADIKFVPLKAQHGINLDEISFVKYERRLGCVLTCSIEDSALIVGMDEYYMGRYEIPPIPEERSETDGTRVEYVLHPRTLGMLIQPEDVEDVIRKKVCLEIPEWKLVIDLEPAKKEKERSAQELLKRIEKCLRPVTGGGNRVPTPMRTMRHSVSHTEPVAILLRSVSDRETEKRGSNKRTEEPVWNVEQEPNENVIGGSEIGEERHMQQDKTDQHSSDLTEEVSSIVEENDTFLADTEERYSRNRYLVKQLSTKYNNICSDGHIISNEIDEEVQENQARLETGAELISETNVGSHSTDNASECSSRGSIAETGVDPFASSESQQQEEEQTKNNNQVSQVDTDGDHSVWVLDSLNDWKNQENQVVKIDSNNNKQQLAKVPENVKNLYKNMNLETEKKAQQFTGLAFKMRETSGIIDTSVSPFLAAQLQLELRSKKKKKKKPGMSRMQIPTENTQPDGDTLLEQVSQDEVSLTVNLNSRLTGKSNSKVYDTDAGPEYIPYISSPVTSTLAHMDKHSVMFQNMSSQANNQLKRGDATNTPPGKQLQRAVTMANTLPSLTGQSARWERAKKEIKRSLSFNFVKQRGQSDDVLPGVTASRRAQNKFAHAQKIAKIDSIIGADLLNDLKKGQDEGNNNNMGASSSRTLGASFHTLKCTSQASSRNLLTSFQNLGEKEGKDHTNNNNNNRETRGPPPLLLRSSKPKSSGVVMTGHESHAAVGNMLANAVKGHASTKSMRDLNEYFSALAKDEDEKEEYLKKNTNTAFPMLVTKRTVFSMYDEKNNTTPVSGLLKQTKTAGRTRGKLMFADDEKSGKSVGKWRKNREKRKSLMQRQSNGGLDKIAVKRKLSMATVKKMSRSGTASSRSILKAKASKVRVSKLRIGSYLKKDIMAIRINFEKMDEDGSGTVDMLELMNNLDKLSYLSDDIAGIFQSIDEDHSGEVTFAEMLKAFMPGCSTEELHAMVEYACAPRLLGVAKIPALTPQEKDDFHAMFRLYDTDNSGTLSIAELYEALNHKPFEAQRDDKALISVEYLKELCEHFNGDDDEELTVEQFIVLMTTAMTELMT